LLDGVCLLVKNEVVILHGGLLTKTAPVNSDCVVGSIDVDNDDNTFYMDTVGGMQDGHRPFLGSHMANDPNHARATVALTPDAIANSIPTQCWS
jgi:hypothetical protein